VPDREDRQEETEAERLDRNLIELLNELRVALPGVQVLFAFLLTVPFTQRFTTLSDAQEKVYYVTLMLTTAATILLIAPSAHHRLQFRQRDKRNIVLVANRLAIVGLALMALAMAGVVLLITDLLFGNTMTAVATSATLAAFAFVWYAIPLARRIRRS
jgi:uncharacterized membrane protein